ncbi:VPS10 domain-containing receptor SorCS1-like protein [Perkinsela sp. CCAP 1560/4]|nr:VPS10 domain-containing receptor SorCS1-like protein [Perkinsela sp. CCAP 1560/4]|eukprot:KNH09576.1 VPS10 domain-containing receptor SorCS1-like protein [Perkinsela sp. CCAP 1560/4]
MAHGESSALISGEVELKIMSRADFANFAYSCYLYTLHEAYGSLVGKDATRRLLEESKGITPEGRTKLESCGISLLTDPNSLPTAADIQDEVVECLAWTHFPNVAEENIAKALGRTDTNVADVGVARKAWNMINQTHPLRFLRGLLTFSVTNDGNVMITVHISERKRVWLLRVFRAAVLSLVMSRGNLESSPVLFCLLSLAWFVQRMIRYVGNRWQPMQATPPESADHEESNVTTQHETVQTESPRPANRGLSQRSIFASLKFFAFMVTAFFTTLNPNYQP